MENLTKQQLILLVLLVSFVTSLVTGIVTVSLVGQQSVANLNPEVSRIVEKFIPVEGKNQQATPAPVVIPSSPSREEIIVKVIKDASPSVVSVVATKDLPVMEQYFVDPFGGNSFFGDLIPNMQIPQYRQKGTEKKQVGSGTGFFISKDGLILTNKHVVEDTKAEYSIVTNDGKKLDAKVLARDPFQDIAILKVEGDNFSPLTLGDSEKISVGQSVIAIGNSLGEFSNTVSIGIVSGLHRSITAQGAMSGPEELQELIQTDAAINPGNSGGPLIDFNGRVIGINTAVAQSAEHIGFALPINIAKRDVSDAKEFGKIKYPYIGVRYKINEDGSLTLVKSATGEPAIDPKGPAAKSGLIENDIIVEIDGVKMGAKNTLAVILSKHRVGDKISLKITRDKKEMTISLTLDERPEGV